MTGPGHTEITQHVHLEMLPNKKHRAAHMLITSFCSGILNTFPSKKANYKTYTFNQQYRLFLCQAIMSHICKLPFYNVSLIMDEFPRHLPHVHDSIFLQIQADDSWFFPRFNCVFKSKSPGAHVTQNKGSIPFCLSHSNPLLSDFGHMPCILH